MKLVINKCFGGFSLSPAAVRRLAELNGRECYFFKNMPGDYEKLVSITEEGTRHSMFWTAFDIPNPDKVIGPSKRDKDGLYKSYKARYEKHELTSRPDDRADPKLIQVVEELGEKADGSCAKLRVIEIPDGTEYEIDDYDGQESVHEVHQSWG
jgi:hypothetical protein